MSKIAYFDCFSGISGDMLIGALLDAGLDFEDFKAELTNLNLPGYDLKCAKVLKQNIAATKFDVLVSDQAPLRHLADLNRIVEASSLAQDIVGKAKEVFLRIAKAEARIHDQPLEKVHFHEIGAVDTVVDVVGALVGLKLLGVEMVFASKLNVGTGFVEFSHGRFPVPAPATAEILRGVPTYATETDVEVLTPTGAAIITTVAREFGTMPVMRTQSIGYGSGAHDLPQPNVLRVFIGELMTSPDSQPDVVTILETNIDDMNPQLYENVFERLLADGALDVYLSNIQMKKNRPGIKLTVLCNPQDESRLTRRIFEETTSIGVRRRTENREILQREIKQIDSRYGKIRVKVSTLNGKILNVSPEYEDCKRAAEEHGVAVKEVYRALNKD